MDELPPSCAKPPPLIWVLGLIVALNNAGYDVGALLAGVGIGGLAMAAAKDFVSNIFGGITVFVDKPCRRPHPNRRLRRHHRGNRHPVHPVADLGRPPGHHPRPNSPTASSKSTIEPARKVSLTLGLAYDTTPERMEEAIGIIRTIIAERTETLQEEPTIWFDGFGDFSLNIQVVYIEGGHWAQPQ